MDAPRAPSPPIRISAATSSPASPRRSAPSRRAGSTTAAARSCSRRSRGSPNIISPAPRPPCSSAAAPTSPGSPARARRWSSSAPAPRSRPGSCSPPRPPRPTSPSTSAAISCAMPRPRSREDFPGLPVHPIEADFTRADRAPGRSSRHCRKLGFFPGSTIGNLVPVDRRRPASRHAPDARHRRLAVHRLRPGQGPRRAASAPMTMPPGSPPSSTSTSSHRINRELGGDIPVEAFRHRAVWNERLSRIEMHLEAERDVDFEVAGAPFHDERGRDHPHREQPQIWRTRRPAAASRRRLDPGRGMDRRGGALRPGAGPGGAGKVGALILIPSIPAKAGIPVEGLSRKRRVTPVPLTHAGATASSTAAPPSPATS